MDLGPGKGLVSGATSEAFLMKKSPQKRLPDSQPMYNSSAAATRTCKLDISLSFPVSLILF
jgi:hypothetical protein